MRWCRLPDLDLKLIWTYVRFERRKLMSVFSVPVTIGVNEEEIANEIRKNVEDRVVEKITKEIKEVIYEKSTYGSRDTNELLKRMVRMQIGEILEKNKSVIVQEAAKALADKMIKTKTVKEAIKETIEKVKED